MIFIQTMLMLKYHIQCAKLLFLQVQEEVIGTQPYSHFFFQFGNAYSQT